MTTYESFTGTSKQDNSITLSQKVSELSVNFNNMPHRIAYHVIHNRVMDIASSRIIFSGNFQFKSTKILFPKSIPFPKYKINMHKSNSLQ